MQFFTNIALAALLIPAALAAAVPKAAKSGDIIENSYIVVLKDSVSTESLKTHTQWAKKLHARSLGKRDGSVQGLEHEYNVGALKGYAGTFDKATIDEIASSTEVAYVEQDKVVKASALTTQASSPWGLSRISHKAKSATNYIYDTTAGEGVTVYIVDTGIRTTHTQFGGRASIGTNIAGGSAGDGNGHGTHVAGTIGGSTYGVAKKATLVGVKVLDDSGSGSTAGVISGVQWVATNGAGKKAVANLSLGGSYSATLNSAVQAAITAGVTFVVAAGNDNANAANYSPASAANAITVGATTSTDARASYSNYGATLDVFAPGSSILSSYNTGDSATATLSGTSMAAPHVAGLAAYLIALEGLSTPAAVRARILALSQSGLVTSPGTGSPNYLVYNGNGA